MKKEFVPYEQALALKELGFDEPCIKYYWTDGMFTKTYESPFNHNKRDNLISAPLYQQAFRWFRDNFNLEGIPFKNLKDNTFWNDNFKTAFYSIRGEYADVVYNTISEEIKSYEEAELECLKKLIEIVKNK